MTAATPRYCSKCGTAASGDASYCPRCGASLDQAPAAWPPRTVPDAAPNKEGNRALTYVLMTLVTVAAVMLAVILLRSAGIMY